MSKSNFYSVPQETENILLRQRDKLLSSNRKTQKKYIHQDSPYSNVINNAISDYNEFLYYYNLKLKEAVVTRPALIKDLDLDLWITSENKTNKELLKEGRSPYAFDAEDGRIELHHIGQKYDSPFAELTVAEHNFYGNSKRLHNLSIESWRQDENKASDFNSEKIRYWQLREKKNFSIVTKPDFKPLEPRNFENDKKLSENIKEILEVIFNELNIDDLNYISNLANSFSLVKKIGFGNISEFVNSKEKDSDIICSFCGANSYISHGSYKTSAEKINRYKCKNCGKVFTQVNNSIISGSNLSFAEWIRFIECLYNGDSVEKTAKICNLSQRSVQTNRYKLFYALKLLDDRTVLKGNVVIDETYIDLSYKGEHPTENTPLPRKSKERGGVHSLGMSKEKVCIACALDEEGNSVARIAGRGAANSKQLSYVFFSAIKKENINCLYADKGLAIRAYAKNNNLPLKSAKLLKKGTVRASNQSINKEVLIVNSYIQRMNSYHARLSKFLSGFLGVSSFHLSGYLYLFAWKERNKYRNKNEAYKELLEVLTSRHLHLSNEEVCSGFFLPDPFKVEDATQKYFRNYQRAIEMYALHAKGLTYKEISKKYKMTPQGIGRIIRKCDALNLGYLTEKEKQKEKLLLEPQSLKQDKYLPADAFLEIYQKKKEWKGDLNEFYNTMIKEYNLSKQTIKNRISIARRIIHLQENIFINNEFQYADLREIYQKIYAEYKEKRNSNIAITACYQELGQKYNYTVRNIMRIIKIMSKDGTEYFNIKKRRLSPNETIKRDKAIFVDYMKWSGSKKDFCSWAADKYNTSSKNVSDSLRLCFIADERRYDMV